MKVRPTGENATYPPLVSTGNPSGYHIDLHLGGEGRLEVDVTVLAPLIGLNPVYARFVGSLSGTVTPVKGAATQGLTGMALQEQFKFCWRL